MRIPPFLQNHDHGLDDGAFFSRQRCNCLFIQKCKGTPHVWVPLSHRSTIKSSVAAPLFFFFSKIEIHLFFQNDAIQPLWGLRLSFEITTIRMTRVSFCAVKLEQVRKMAVVSRARDL
jgi:hypothetical protein